MLQTITIISYFDGHSHFVMKGCLGYVSLIYHNYKNAMYVIWSKYRGFGKDMDLYRCLFTFRQGDYKLKETIMMFQYNSISILVPVV